MTSERNLRSSKIDKNNLPMYSDSTNYQNQNLYNIDYQSDEISKDINYKALNEKSNDVTDNMKMVDSMIKYEMDEVDDKKIVDEKKQNASEDSEEFDDDDNDPNFNEDDEEEEEEDKGGGKIIDDIKWKDLNKDLPKFKKFKIKFIKNENRKQGPPCGCVKHNCYEAIGKKDRKAIFDNFWQINAASEQNDYLCSCIHAKEPKKADGRNIKFIYTVKIPPDGKKIVQLCKTAFLNLHGLEKCHIERLLSKFNRRYIVKREEEEAQAPRSQTELSARDFIRNSLEFKSCRGKSNIRSCYKKYLDEFRGKKIISEYKFRHMFRDELDMKLERMCRVCLNMCDRKILYNIFSIRDEIEVNKAITDLSHIEISRLENNLPQMICRKCMDRLYDCLDFRQLCIDSDKILRSDQSRPNITVKRERKNNHHDETKVKSEPIEDYFDNFNERSSEDDLSFTSNDPFEAEFSKNDDNKVENIDDILIKLETNQMPNDNNSNEIITNNTTNNNGNLENLNLPVKLRIKKHHEYDFLKNRHVNSIGKVQGPPCRCHKHCYTKINRQLRRRLFKLFWQIRRVNKQNSFLHDCVKSVPVDVERRKRRTEIRGKEIKGPRQKILYFIPVDGKNVQVCKVAFKNIFCITKKRLDTVLRVKRAECTTQFNEDGTPKIQNDISLNATTISKVANSVLDDQQFNMLEKNESKNDSEESEFSSDDPEEKIPEDMIQKHFCEICNKMFNLRRSLAYHKRKNDHFTNEERIKRKRALCFKPNALGQWVCSDCDQIFLEKKKFLFHKSYWHSLKTYTCEICGQIFNRLRPFQRHRYHHDGIRRFHCDYCGKSFFTQDLLGKHRRTHFRGANQHNRQHMQNFQGQNITVENQFPVAVVRPLTQQRQHRCEFCGSTFAHTTLLNEHIMLCHSNLITVAPSIPPIQLNY